MSATKVYSAMVDVLDYFNLKVEQHVVVAKVTS